jgi:biopolymer transport protein TolR
MQVGATRGGVVSDPNIVPLIDVLLVLIIIFMVITPTMSNGLPVVIPQPAPPKTQQLNPDTVVVRVLQGGKLMINDDDADWNTLGVRISKIFGQRAEKVAFVTGAQEVSFAEVARAIDIMRTAGVDHIGLITTNISR